MNKLFVDRLTVIDFSYFDAQRGILGESWIVDLMLEGELDEQGMVFDFGHVKKQIKELIDLEFDHRFVISSSTKDLEVNEEQGRTTLAWTNRAGCYQHASPSEAVVILECKRINTKTVSAYLETMLRRTLPSNVTDVKLSLYEEAIEGAYYHYSHGLKKHDGNCQRIVHGHRSKIEIFENHQRSETLEDYWAACFRNSYIATRDDLQEELDLEAKKHLRFSYTSQQGEFSLTMPAKRVYLLDSDSTVELIAQHIAQKSAELHPNNHFLVKAYEGVGKGSIAEARV